MFVIRFLKVKYKSHNVLFGPYAPSNKLIFNFQELNNVLLFGIQGLNEGGE